ncbi:MAG: hypothetical protein Tsb005_15620 [Gammaproteobacteria bacterium]
MQASKLNQALRDPSSVFNRPNQILDHRELTAAQKINILERWRYDLCNELVAEEENMASNLESNQTSNLLETVLDAIHQLDASADIHRSSPTKQG